MTTTSIDHTESLWDTEMSAFGDLPLGDVPVRMAVRDMLLGAADSTDAQLRLGTRLAAAIRVAEIAVEAAAHEGRGKKHPPFDASHQNDIMHAAQTKVRPLYLALGMRDIGHPFLDTISERDYATILASLRGIADLSAIKAGVVDKLPAPLLRFTGLVDLVSLGGTEPLRLLKDRPRGFSADALEGMVIPAEPSRFKADDSAHSLRIDWIENADKFAHIKSSPKGEQKQTTSITLNKANPYVKLYGKDLHGQTWTVTVLDIPKPKETSDG